ncbi:MAG: hypothetical protein AAGL66_09590 [Pseudomonadota bacterium]
MCRRLIPLVLISALSMSSAAQAQNLLLTLSAQPTVRGTVSTRQANELSLVAAPGNTLSFARAEGREQRLVAGGGWFWTQVEDVPLNSESLEMTPRLLEDGNVEVSLSVARKEGTGLQRFSSTVIAEPGKWTQLYGPSSAAAGGAKVYGTQSVSGDSLYLRVERR